MTTYKMGDPLDMLAEEGIEIAHARFKMIRFGADGSGFPGRIPLRELHQEVGDFLAVVSHCMAIGILDENEISAAIARKRQKVRTLFGVELKTWKDEEPENPAIDGGKYQEALTPSEETKAAYIGEFSFPLPETDDEGSEVMRQISVPWKTIKEIMAAIRSRAEGGAA